jgi:zinc protease
MPRTTFAALFVTLLLLTVPGLLAAAQASEAEGDILPFQAVSRTLPNGLVVIVVPTGFPNLVSVQIPVQTGSRNEVEPGKSGFAHFFEHMMFRGTPNFSSTEYEAILNRAGARRNAYTTDDFTNYHATFAKEDLETVLMVEADRFQNLEYSVEDFKTEARAVLGEYNKNSANPISKLLEAQRERAFRVHPYQHTTMGFLADIEEMPNQFDYSRIFFQRWYRPENTAVIVAGDVDPDEAFRLVEKHWGGWSPAGEGNAPAIPGEPAPQGPTYTHVAWPTPTLPYVTVAFHGPAFSTSDKDLAALAAILDLYFGSTSELYKRLVEDEQKVDQLFGYHPGNADPYLVTLFARVKDPADALYVRDQLLATFARARAESPDAERLADAKSNARYGFSRALDNTDRIAATLARFVRYERSYDTLNDYFRLYSTLTTDDLQRAARRWFTDERMVVTTLAEGALPEGIGALPSMADLEPRRQPAEGVTFVEQRSDLPQVNLKLLFTAGSAHDPAGKEGLATLAASMIAEAGSERMTLAEIKKALYPLAGGFRAQVDKEMTAFTATFHPETSDRFLGIALPMLLAPGFREEDFNRLKAQQLNALVQDLRTNNEEELGKEALHGVIFRGTPYQHPVLGTVAGIEAITLDDVRAFVRRAYTRANLTVGLAGRYAPELAVRVRTELGALPAETDLVPPPDLRGRMPQGREVTIVQKETRATAISIGHPIEVTRAHPDYAALWLARAWLGEHRSAMSYLYQRIREVRGMNYGTYAYIEAFPRGMFQFFPDPNIARQAQIFEIWIRPVEPRNAHLALRIAIHELEQLIANGLTQEQLDDTREYLMKNVFVMTSTQDQFLGYALDSRWYGIGDFPTYMRERLATLTLEQVNAAIRRHLSAENLAIVMIEKDAEALGERLVSDAFSPITYDAEKPAELLAEDQAIGAKPLGIEAAKVTVVPVTEVFAR